MKGSERPKGMYKSERQGRKGKERDGRKVT